MSNLTIILHDNDNSKFFELYKKYNKNNEWEKVEPSNGEILGILTVNEILKNDKSLYLKKCEFNIEDFEKNGREEIEKIIEFLEVEYSIGKGIKIYIDIKTGCISSKLLSKLLKKYGTKDNKTSGINCYNFGKTYILNKTFFENRYAVFADNIDHEVINIFKDDIGNRYFYLCKDGKLPEDYNCKSKKMPNNYIDVNNIELINYSKYSEGNTSMYVILQKACVDIYDTAFKTERIKDDYNDIKYNEVNIYDIFSHNHYTGVNRNYHENTDDFDANVAGTDPLITFKLKENKKVFIPQNIENATFTFNDDGFENLASSSCKQYVFEGTNLFDGLNLVIANNEWLEEEAKTLEDYINSDNFNDDYEEDYLVKIINKTNKETYYSQILSYVLTKSKDILEKFLGVNINYVKKVYNERFNMDVCVDFVDSNDKEHLLVIENKIDASLTGKGEKELQDFFIKKYENNVKDVEKDFREYKNTPGNNKLENQLTKYYLIAKVIQKIKNIEDNNLHFFMLAPKYKEDYLVDDKNNFYYGEYYTVKTYLDLRNAITEVIEDNNSDFNRLLNCEKDIITQFYRSIWPYTNNSSMYYTRKISNKFARLTKKIKESNLNND